MRTPNPEQKLAIEHVGGVILKAGAGSGKTFVLVEHIVYLTQKFIDKNQDIKGEDFSRALSSYFSKIVLMTFTKKAAGELETRVRIRVKQLAEKDPRWQQAQDQLGHLNISTIHGFCHKLLTQGYITDLSPEIEILTEIEYKSKIEKLIDDWPKLKELSPEFSELVFGNKKVISESFHSVFSSPELRSIWAESSSLEAPTISLEDFFKEIFDLLEIDANSRLNFSDYSEFSSKKWLQNLQGYFAVERDYPLNSIESFEVHCTYLEGIKRLTKPSGENVELIKYHQKVKAVKDFFKAQKENIYAFYNGDISFYNSWYLLLKELFDHVNVRMPFFFGLNYSDLEYYTLKGLEDPEIASKIRKNYNYFIVDEFQDTGPGQFSILTKLVDGNFDKLFCVGDLKQAIYGFRGGEIGVFKACEKVIPKNLSLANNYRSGKKIIEFCNNFFQLVFTLDAKLKDRVKAPFEIDSQVFPGDENSGEIIRVCADVDDTNLDRRPSRRDMEIIETLSILDRVKEIGAGEEICVLYRALAPSRFLIHYLIKEHKAFLAQVKIPHNEDPVLGIFKVLLESYLNDDEKISYTYYHIMLKSYLGHLKLPVPENLELLLSTFKGDLSSIGVLEAFRKFFFSLGLSNSNHTHNMQLLASLITINLENIELIWDQMNQGRNSNYAFEFQLGKGGGKLKLMTVHASKGLEFDHVILGGIHVKSNPPSNTQVLGKGPNALLWKEKQGKGKFLPSPGYILEKEMVSKKEASESKRLLYVACTRPKKSLSWIDVSIGGKKQKWGNDPWILAFRQIEDEITTKDLKLDPNAVFRGENLDNPTPFFHKGAQGMAPKLDHLADIHKLGTLSELSVTRLATLLDCPRKFYLQNICRLDDGDLDSYYDEDFDEAKEIKSSSKRGTRIHAQISKMIESEDMGNIKPEDQKAIAFAKKNLEVDGIFYF